MAVAVAVGVSLAAGSVALGEAVGVVVGTLVALGEAVAVEVGTPVSVGVGVSVVVPVAVGVAVWVLVPLGVGLGVMLGVAVGVRLACVVGVRDGGTNCVGVASSVPVGVAGVVVRVAVASAGDTGGSTESAINPAQ